MYKIQNLTVRVAKKLPNHIWWYIGFLIKLQIWTWATRRAVDLVPLSSIEFGVPEDYEIVLFSFFHKMGRLPRNTLFINQEKRKGNQEKTTVTMIMMLGFTPFF